MVIPLKSNTIAMALAKTHVGEFYSNQITLTGLVSSKNYLTRPGGRITLIAKDGIRQGGTNSGGGGYWRTG